MAVSKFPFSIFPSLPSTSSLPTKTHPSLTPFQTLTSHDEPFSHSILAANASTRRIIIHCNNPDSLGSPQTREGLLYSFLGEMGFNEKETELLFERNPALKLASFESIRSRVFSLQSVLGLNGFESYRLIGKFPILLTSKEIDPFLLFVVSGLPEKIEPMQLKRVLATAEPKYLVGFDQKVHLLVSYGVPEDKIIHVLNSVNLSKAFCLKSVEEIHRTLTYLCWVGGVEMIVKRPMVLNFDLDSQLIPKVEFFKKLSGGNEETAWAVLRKLPAILNYTLEHLESHAELLRSFAGLSDLQIYKIFHVFPSIVSVSKERKLYPRIDFLKQCGLDSDEIFKFLIKAPLFLGLSFEENLMHKLVFLVKIGYRYRTKDMAVAMGATTRTSCENLQNVVGLFLSYGLSCGDILAMSKKHPQILQYNSQSLEKKMEYLIEEIGRDVGELLSFPAFLGYNLDNRIKHRYEVKKKVIGEHMSLNKLLSVSADKFSAKERGKSDSLMKTPTLDES